MVRWWRRVADNAEMKEVCIFVQSRVGERNKAGAGRRGMRVASKAEDSSAAETVQEAGCWWPKGG
jgi:hypothetical protein